MYKLLTLDKCFAFLGVFITAFYFIHGEHFWTCLEDIVERTVESYLQYFRVFVKFKRTNQSCSLPKISQSINMQLISW